MWAMPRLFDRRLAAVEAVAEDDLGRLERAEVATRAVRSFDAALVALEHKAKLVRAAADVSCVDRRTARQQCMGLRRSPVVAQRAEIRGARAIAARDGAMGRIDV